MDMKILDSERCRRVVLLSRVLSKSLLSLVLVLVGNLCVAGEATLSFHNDGQDIHLTSEESQRIVRTIENLVRSANFNSKDHAYLWSAPTSPSVETIKQGSFLHVHYGTPATFASIGGELIADDVWIGIPAPGPDARPFPGPTWVVSGNQSISLGKESGYILIELGLDPGIYPHLPPQMQKILATGEIGKAILKKSRTDGDR